MKKILLLFFATSLALYGIAQEKNRIAILDPSCSGMNDEGTKVAIREIISSTIVNLGGYSIVERSLLEKVMSEQNFSNSGAVDDTQATEIGKLAGAKKVIVSVVTKTGNRRMLTVKMIDVKTATVERQKFKIVNEHELLDIVALITSEVFEDVDSETTKDLISANAKNNRTTNAEADNIKKTTTSEEESIPNVETAISSGEIRLYLAPGYKPKKEKHNDNVISVFLDGEQIGGGTLATGFDIIIKDPKPGKHKLTFAGTVLGEMTAYKINTLNHNYFNFVISRWVYLGRSMYSVRLKEAKKY